MMETDNIYLIAHKVRGQPALDIAIQCGIAGEEAYVVCSSGHRAYPYFSMAVSNLYRDGIDGFVSIFEMIPPMPAEAVDHFEEKFAKDIKLPSVDVLALLGLGGMKKNAVPSEFKRRI